MKIPKEIAKAEFEFMLLFQDLFSTKNLDLN